MMRRFTKALAILAFVAVTVPSMVNAGDESTGLPVPRFVSLRANQVNLRSGPGVRYPVEWVYLKRDLPVEIISEFESWRKIRDWENSEGWVHQSMLSGRRMVRTLGTEQNLRRNPNEEGRPVARVEAGVVGKLLQCKRDMQYCRVEIGGFQGWLKRSEFWGIYPGEHIE